MQVGLNDNNFEFLGEAGNSTSNALINPASVVNVENQDSRRKDDSKCKNCCFACGFCLSCCDCLTQTIEGITACCLL